MTHQYDPQCYYYSMLRRYYFDIWTNERGTPCAQYVISTTLDLLIRYLSRFGCLFLQSVLDHSICNVKLPCSCIFFIVGYERGWSIS